MTVQLDDGVDPSSIGQTSYNSVLAIDLLELLGDLQCAVRTVVVDDNDLVVNVAIA